MFIKKLTKQVICDPDNPVVNTNNGKIRGLIVDDTYIFRGIKYANAKRFHMPEPVESWEGVKDAIVYGNVCPEIQTVQPHDNYTVPHVFYPQNEDCQYLNIWTQNINYKTKRPVMVWLHGGGFSTGSGIEHFAYDGENMSRFGDVVVVTLNHRLNILGFLDLSEYGEQYKYSGNVGMADIVSALEWIKNNIEAFGGDPHNVTIFGQSGGGGKVCALLQMPLAHGLFHKAIIQSGVIKKNSGKDNNNQISAKKIMKGLGIKTKNVKELETVPYYRLAQTVMNSDFGINAMMHFGPTKDSDYYLGSVFDVGICEYAKKIPIIIGTVIGEFSNNFDFELSNGRKNEWSRKKQKKLIYKYLGDDTDEAIEAFSKAYPKRNIVDLLFTDDMFRKGAIEYLALRVESGCTDTYNYMFNLESLLYGGILPWHNAEIPYVFHNADYIESAYIPGITEWMQEILCGAWTSFAKSGCPDYVGMPHWEKVSPGNLTTMIFDKDVEIVNNHDLELMKVLNKTEVKLKQNKRRETAKLFGGGPRE